jgi:hypothetical protein
MKLGEALEEARGGWYTDYRTENYNKYLKRFILISGKF